MESVKQLKYQVWLLVIAVFALGSVTGGALDRLYLSRAGQLRQHNGGRGPGRMLEQMKTDLNLSDNQAQAIKKIFDESKQKDEMRQIMSQCPGMKEMWKKHHEQVRAVLNPDQQKRYDEISAERAKKFNSPPSVSPSPIAGQ